MPSPARHAFFAQTPSRPEVLLRKMILDEKLGQHMLFLDGV